MRRWLQQFTWERIAGTNKIRIRPFVEPVVNLKLVENVEWFAHLAPQILQQLARAVNGNGCNAASKHFKELIISGTEAYLRFGLVNPTWLKLRNAELDGYSKDDQFTFMESSNDKLYDVLYSTLRQLERHGLVRARRTYVVEDAGLIRIASENELEWLKLKSSALLADMRLWNERRLYRSGRAEEFYDKLSKSFLDKHGLYLGHKVWRVTYLPERLERFVSHGSETCKRLTNLESTRWHVKQLGTPYGGIINMVIPQQSLLDSLEESLNAQKSAAQ
jgi:hypothetical protein